MIILICPRKGLNSVPWERQLTCFQLSHTFLLWKSQKKLFFSFSKNSVDGRASSLFILAHFFTHFQRFSESEFKKLRTENKRDHFGYKMFFIPYRLVSGPQYLNIADQINLDWTFTARNLCKVFTRKIYPETVCFKAGTISIPKGSFINDVTLCLTSPILV